MTLILMSKSETYLKNSDGLSTVNKFTTKPGIQRKRLGFLLDYPGSPRATSNRLPSTTV